MTTPTGGPTSGNGTGSGSWGVPTHGQPQPTRFGAAPQTSRFGTPPQPFGHQPGPPPSGFPTVSPVVLPFQPVPQRRGMDRFAIAAFILSFVPGASLLGLVFGLLALQRIKREGGGGRALATIAVVLSGLWIVSLMFAGAVREVFGPSSDLATTSTRSEPAGQAAAQGEQVALGDLTLGDCVATFRVGTVRRVPVIPCTELHQAQVVAEVPLEGKKYPGQKQLDAVAEDRCMTALPASVLTKATEQHRLAYLYPGNIDWRGGMHHIVCFVALREGVMTGSMLETIRS